MEQYKKASLTIELSLIFPGILSVIILIIFTGFFVHDRCVIVRMSYEMANRYTANIRTGSKYTYTDVTRPNMIDADEIRENLVGKWDINSEVSESGDEVIIRIRGQMKLMDGFITEYIGNHIFNVEIQQRALKLTGTDYIRKKWE